MFDKKTKQKNKNNKSIILIFLFWEEFHIQSFFKILRLAGSKRRLKSRIDIWTFLKKKRKSISENGNTIKEKGWTFTIVFVSIFLPGELNKLHNDNNNEKKKVEKRLQWGRRSGSVYYNCITFVFFFLCFVF